MTRMEKRPAVFLSYTEARGITFEFNRYGVLCDGGDGNSLEHGSSGLVRYNWIEGGNRAGDLIDSEYAEVNGAGDYHDSFVYGNVLIELDGECRGQRSEPTTRSRQRTRSRATANGRALTTPALSNEAQRD